MSEDRLGSVAAALLLGGASSRMGEDKALRTVHGEPAALRLARLLASLCDELLLVGGHPPAEAPGRRVPDPPGAPRCALRGLVAALDAARAPFVLVLATDQLAAAPGWLLALLACPEADVVAPRVDGRVQPLGALYRRETVLPVARARLAEGELALRDLLDAVETRPLEGPALEAVAPRGVAVAGANSPAQWRALESTLAGDGGAR